MDVSKTPRLMCNFLTRRDRASTSNPTDGRVSSTVVITLQWRDDGGGVKEKSNEANKPR